MSEKLEIFSGFATVEYIVKEKSPYGLQRKFYQIAEFGVDENFRRMGVATKLINFCKQEALTGRNLMCGNLTRVQ